IRFIFFLFFSFLCFSFPPIPTSSSFSLNSFYLLLIPFPIYFLPISSPFDPISHPFFSFLPILFPFDPISHPFFSLFYPFYFLLTPFPTLFSLFFTHFISFFSFSLLQNVKLLDQFICPHSGVIFHPIHTGICMQQHKRLSQAIAQAQAHGEPQIWIFSKSQPPCFPPKPLNLPFPGLLWLHVPFVPVPEEDFSNQHAAVGKTPPAPALRERGRAWYPWYEWQQPPAAEVARMRRIYRGFLKDNYPDTPPNPAGK
uniref:Small ribosomal subunit protein mS40 n=1 Tax=Ficedula albicollis TaxID=59894 RepID=A0A803V475_FICAL